MSTATIIAAAPDRSAHAPPASAEPRRIVHRTRGHRHGPIVRLVSPSELGELIKPFVFLDFFDVDASAAPAFGYHPHSGIATLSMLLEGGFSYEDSTGAKGTMAAKGVEWMQAGGGVWHTGQGTGERMKGYQLWVALPPRLESADATSLYLDPEAFQSDGPARVILGELGPARSPIESPSPMNYLEVRLAAGQAWRYEPPPGHDVAWIAVHEGEVLAPQAVAAGELAVFAEGSSSILFEATRGSGFIVGSAAKHPHALVLGPYSVHTQPGALAAGEMNIRRIRDDMRRPGTLRRGLASRQT